ncbi:DNA/RNA non-specific endonuclease [Symmachiella dynata]|uniref:DNA/RNA non-specific endonuclease n=1 Tax=Symmachiella dynata TaxID=2527995 RepID=UPI00118ABBA8|nr:DNA/RNA non-specific endonuclease [Symmachiella dynata]QDT51937.1 DNA/RNA non-specific endonuclease [Symmachiella dynata]
MSSYTSPLDSLRQDHEVMENLRDLFGSRRKVDELELAQEVHPLNRRAIVEFLDDPVGPTENHSSDDAFFSEAIVLATGRPSLFIQDNEIQLGNVQLPNLKQRLEANRATIEHPIPAIGRVELMFHPDYEWVGTGWLIEGSMLVTNRHVANIFAERRGGAYAFRQFAGNTVSAWIDFREEHHRADAIEIEVESILYVANTGSRNPDIAILKLRNQGNLPPHLELAAADANQRDHVGVVGYPAWDGRRNPGPAMSRIFQDIYNVKRYAPGQIADVRSGVITHDCSTLGGNSGSPVLDQTTGKVVGLHFAGRFMSENYALPVSAIKRELRRVTTQVAVDDFPVSVESLNNRRGYAEAFLGNRSLAVPLPALNSDQLDHAAPVSGRERDRGIGKYVLDYTHFSVVMNKTRRLAYYAAVNIDGTQEVAVRRTNTRWRVDPRIDRNHQHDNDLYVRNKLDRGHLVRRLDPVWGDYNEAKRANDDTFHYTNAAPQHARLNQRDWLALEDYLLVNTNQDDQKLTVFTGPVFTRCDTDYRGTTLPEDFWKVAVMVQDDDLLATGYLLSQKQFMDDLEFVIGEFRTYQTPIRTIEQLTGLSFGNLAEHDPLDATEAFGFPTINGPNDIILG